MEFGLFNIMQKVDRSKTDREVFEEALQQTELAEDLGFASAWFVEHHFFNYSLCPSPLMMIAAAAQRTKKIRLASGILVLPLYEPVRLLQEICMTDALAEGRLDVGIGSGYQDYEFERFRVELEKNMVMTTEMMDILEQGLTQDEISYDGDYYKLPETKIALSPYQKPLPRIWVAGMMNNDDFKRRVVSHNYMPILASATRPVSALAPVRAAYDTAYRDAGVDPANTPMGLMRYFHCTHSKEDAALATKAARDSTRISLSLRLNYAEFDGVLAKPIPYKDEETIEKMQERLIVGDPETCVKRILEDLDVMRAHHIALFAQPGALDHGKVCKSMELFTKEAIPLLEKELGKPLSEIGPQIGDITPKVGSGQKVAAE